MKLNVCVQSSMKESSTHFYVDRASQSFGDSTPRKRTGMEALRRDCRMECVDFHRE